MEGKTWPRVTAESSAPAALCREYAAGWRGTGWSSRAILTCHKITPPDGRGSDSKTDFLWQPQDIKWRLVRALFL